jgi:hypothetical protein
MNQERSPAPRRPYEIFGFSEKERLYWRVSNARFNEILEDQQTLIHEFNESSNNYGEFLFVTTSRLGDQDRIFITFFGYGYHEHRELWFTDEWFWYQSNPRDYQQSNPISKVEAQELLQERLADIRPDIREDTQTEKGKFFELLADLTDEDSALAEMDEIEPFLDWILPPEKEDKKTILPTGENLLDDESQEKLPPLYSGEEQGLDALAQVKFFTPDAQWTWYASEFDGEDIFFGLVIGFEIELGYFSLSELKSVKGPLGLQIERDLHYDPQTLRELIEKHQSERE